MRLRGQTGDRRTRGDGIRSLPSLRRLADLCTRSVDKPADNLRASLKIGNKSMRCRHSKKNTQETDNLFTKIVGNPGDKTLAT